MGATRGHCYGVGWRGLWGLGAGETPLAAQESPGWRAREPFPLSGLASSEQEMGCSQCPPRACWAIEPDPSRDFGNGSQGEEHHLSLSGLL